MRLVGNWSIPVFASLLVLSSFLLGYRSRRLQQRLLRWLLASSRRQPVLIIFVGRFTAFKRVQIFDGFDSLERPPRILLQIFLFFAIFFGKVFVLQLLIRLLAHFDLFGPLGDAQLYRRRGSQVMVANPLGVLGVDRITMCFSSLMPAG